MMRVLAAGSAAALAILILSGPSAARADVTVIGNGLAAACSTWAREASTTGASHADAIQECTLAIEQEALSRHELAATYVNRGVIHLARGGYADAKRDFDSAVRIEPTLGEAYVNRGAALIGMDRLREGIAEIDRGLQLDATEPEKAYFNRALADERLNDLKAAYEDYSKALELKPDWAMAKTELARFHVERR